MSRKHHIEVVIPIRTKTEGNTNEHWHTKAKRAEVQKRAAYTLVMPYVRNLELGWAAVGLTRIAPGVLDAHDNLPSSQKHIVDGIAFALGIDDKDPRVKWRYDQRKGPPGYYAVRIEIDFTERAQPCKRSATTTSVTSSGSLRKPKRRSVSTRARVSSSSN